MTVEYLLYLVYVKLYATAINDCVSSLQGQKQIRGGDGELGAWDWSIICERLMAKPC